jgi:hypothetical protein
MATQPDNGSSIGDLLRQLIEDVGLLFRTELRLAQAEVGSKLAGLKTGAAAIAAGGMLLLAALFVLLGAFVGFLEPHVGAGWAAVIVAVATAVVGFILISVGGGKLKVASLTPDRTLASVKQDVETLKGN